MASRARIDIDPPQVPIVIPWPGGPVTMTNMVNLNGLACQFCGHGSQAGVGAWEVQREGATVTRLLMCYECAVGVAATMLGWDDGGDWLAPLRALRDGGRDVDAGA